MFYWDIYALLNDNMNELTEKTTILFAHSAGDQGAAGKGSYDLVINLQNSVGSGYQIQYPIVSQPNEPTYARWKTLLEREFRKIKTDIILIGHSLGGSMLLKYLSEEKTTVPIAGLFLVAIPQWSQDGWNAKEFALKPDFAQRLPAIGSIHFFHCMNDPIVPFQHLNFYQKFLNEAVFHALECGDHAFAQGLPELTKAIQLL